MRCSERIFPSRAALSSDPTYPRIIEVLIMRNSNWWRISIIKFQRDGFFLIIIVTSFAVVIQAKRRLPRMTQVRYIESYLKLYLLHALVYSKPSHPGFSFLILAPDLTWNPAGINLHSH